MIEASNGKIRLWDRWLVAAILFLATAYFYQDPGWNGNSRLDLARAIVERQTLRIDAYQALPGWDTGDKALFEGHYYSDKAIGSSALAVPFLLILGGLGSLFAVPSSADLLKHGLTLCVIGTAFTLQGVALYEIALRIANKRWKALLATIAVCLGTMLWPYSVVFYGHVLAAALLAIAFYLVFISNGASPSLSRWFWAGLALGFGFLADYSVAPIVLGIVFYSLYVTRAAPLGARLRIGLTGFAGAFLPLLLMLLYNVAVYHTPLAFGYMHEAEDQFQTIMGLGFLGIRSPSKAATYHITLDPKFGLFWLSPVLLLAIPGYFMALKTARYRAEALLALFAFGSMLVINAGSYMWWGGSAFGPRLLIPALPFFIVPLALLPKKLLGVMAVLAVVSSLQMLIPLAGQIQFTKLDYKINREVFYVAEAPFEGISLLYQYGLPQIFRQYKAGTPSWTLGAAVGLPYWLSIPALLLAESAFLVLFRRQNPAADVALTDGP